MSNNILLYLFFFFTLISCGTRDAEEIIMVQDFFGKPERTNFKVSPDGSKIAYLGLEDHCRNIFILNIDQPDSSKQLTQENNMNVQYFFWANADTIVYSISQSNEDSLRLFSVDIHHEKSNYLIRPAKHTIRWLNPTKAINGQLLAQMNNRDSTVFDLYRIPLDGREPTLVDINTSQYQSWFMSNDGKVRLALTSDSVHDKLWFRKEEGQMYTPIVETDFETTILPLGPVKDSQNEIFALSNRGRDKMAVVKMNLESGAEQVFESHANLDMARDGYLFSRNEMVYTAVNDKKKNLKIYNPQLSKIYGKLKRNFEDYAIDILDADSAFQLVVFKTYTDVNPGGVYYYSTNQDKIVELTSVTPTLAGKKFSPMQEIAFNSRDGMEIKGYLTLPLQKQKNYPVVVLVHDGPSRRDVWGFNQEVQFLANRGYAVFQVNYRGSAGFGKKFFVAGFKQWGGEIQNDINDGVAWLIHEGIADKERIAIMGTGFGGYSAMYAACFNPTLYKCAISSSGYLNLFTYFKEIPAYYQSYLQTYYRIIGDPQKEYELFKAISPLFHAEKVRMPILLFQGGKDRYNSMTDVHQFVQKVRNNNVHVDYMYKEDEGRRFRNEENIIAYYQLIERFLKEQMK